tara:strand:+ start:19155 stop:19499 length:345 start_codon:yes stop_codon:yes gene_type:complete
MNFNEFKTELQRIEGEFRGEYGSERTLMIWKECQGLKVEQCKKVFDEIIASARALPTVKDFRMSLAGLRERQQQAFREREKSEARRFVQTVPMPEGIRQRFRQIGLMNTGEKSE